VGSAEGQGPSGGTHRATRPLAIGLTLGDVPGRGEPPLGRFEVAGGDRFRVGLGDAVQCGGSQLHPPDIDARDRGA